MFAFCFISKPHWQVYHMNNCIGALKCSGPYYTHKFCCLLIINIFWLIRNAKETAQHAAMKFLGTNLNLVKKTPSKPPLHPNDATDLHWGKGDTGNCCSPIMDNLGTQLWTGAGSSPSMATGKVLSGTGILGVARTAELTGAQSSCGGEGCRWWDFQIHSSVCGNHGDPGRPDFESETSSHVLLKFCTGNCRTWKPIKTQFIFYLHSDFLKMLLSLINVEIGKFSFGEAA